jgi:hypothetical protein
VYAREALQIPIEQENIKVHVEDLDEVKRRQLQAYYPGHIILSESESLGMVGLEGEAAGAFLLGNRLPTYEETYSEGRTQGSVYVIDSELETLKAGVKDTFNKLTVEQLEGGIEVFRSLDIEEVRKNQKKNSLKRIEKLEEKLHRILEDLFQSEIYTNERKTSLRTLPPQVGELPNISVITLLHNRRSFIDLAMARLLPILSMTSTVREPGEVKKYFSDAAFTAAPEPGSDFPVVATLALSIDSQEISSSRHRLLYIPFLTASPQTCLQLSGSIS